MYVVVSLWGNVTGQKMLKEVKPSTKTWFSVVRRHCYAHLFLQVFYMLEDIQGNRDESRIA